MARQTGPNPFIGRRGNLQGYRMAGQHYARIVSSLTGQRVKKDPAFQQTMQYAALLGRASRIASAVYRQLPAKEHNFYRKLTGMAMQLLKQGKTPEVALEQLDREFVPIAISLGRPQRTPASETRFAEDALKRLFSKPWEEELKMESTRNRGSLYYPVSVGPPG